MDKQGNQSQQMQHNSTNKNSNARGVCEICSKLTIQTE